MNMSFFQWGLSLGIASGMHEGECLRDALALRLVLLRLSMGMGVSATNRSAGRDASGSGARLA